MTKHTKKELEEMLYYVVDKLDLSDVMVDKHGPNGTPPALQARLAQELLWEAKEALNNKRLIAAAPYLLNALQMLYEETVDYIRRNNLGGEDNQCMQMARNALAMCSLNWRT